MSRTHNVQDDPAGSASNRAPCHFSTNPNNPRAATHRRGSLANSKEMTMGRTEQAPSREPYAMVGAGPLVSNIWKTGDVRGGWSYRFNLYRMSGQSGHVSQLLRPADVRELVKLCQVLAFTFADDGCIPTGQCGELSQLAAQLDQITRTWS